MRWSDDGVALTLLLVATFRWHTTAEAYERPSTLIVIYVEGLGKHYLQDDSELMEKLTGFKEIKENGYEAHSLKPDFPTEAANNFATIFTGLHSDGHGITGNVVLRPGTLDPVQLRDPDKPFYSNEFAKYMSRESELFWITSRYQSQPSVLYNWPLCVTEIRSNTFSDCKKPSEIGPNKRLGDYIPEILNDVKTNGVQLVMFHHNKLAVQGRKYGPQSGFTESALIDLSADLFKLQNVLSTYELWDRGEKDGRIHNGVNLVVVSDHGMIHTPTMAMRFIDDYVEMSLVASVINSGAYMWIAPFAGDRNLHKVKHAIMSSNIMPYCQLYDEHTLPPRWHLGIQLAPLLVVCKPGHTIYVREASRAKLFPSVVVPTEMNAEYFGHGRNGYDNADSKMDGILLARGSDFSSNCPRERLNAVDVYSIFCRLLNVKPHNEGPNKMTANVLCDSHTSAQSRPQIWLSTIIVSITAYFILC